MRNLQFDGVIFDMDGVIIDSERVSLKCWEMAAEPYGISKDEIWAVKLVYRRNDFFS